ncbi:MAG: Arc/MetJ-type ribon-helix-helix transcriptional regulator [Halobacteriales archaeon]|jgi:Arc/MetJ-type ribon-helix-helix transcriptional regulator
MSKITFRADDELIEELESFDASKSEVMREALRQYLDRHADDVETEPDDGAAADPEAETIDALIEDRIDALIEERLDGVGVGRRPPQDVNVNISLEGATPEASEADVSDQRTQASTAEGEEREAPDDPTTCPQCGEDVGEGHVYCPNCGEKMSRRVFCECGDEIRSDWAFCPSCGRRTPAADVLESS